jgi:peptide/nickel transport system permease protein
MGQYALRRIVAMGPVAFIVSLLVFALIMVLPGDPAMMMLGDSNNPTAYAALRAELGLDDPLPVQYFEWISGVLRGDFGKSLRTHQPISEEIMLRVAPTLQLAAMALGLALMVSVPVGVLSALKPGSKADSIATLLALTGVAIPNFFLAILLIQLLAVVFRILPPSGYTPPTEDFGANLKLMLMPAITLSTGLMAVQMRHVRSSMLEVLQQEYVTTARSKGLQERVVVWGHALRNALIPLVTIVGLETGALISGTVITESIFSIPGMGRLLVDSITFRDYPTVQAMVLLLALVVLVANLLADLTYGLLDPRVRYGRRARA